MTPRLRIIPIFILILVALAALANPSPARAALGIFSITPNLIVNDIANEITITGSDFTSSMQVLLDMTYITTTFENANSMKAIVPQGFPPGVYTVTVADSNLGIQVSLAAGLTIASPTPVPTATKVIIPTSTPTEPPFARPQMVLASYSASVSAVQTGREFDLHIRLYNAGSLKAYSVQVNFSSADLLMLKNGGVAALGNIDYDSVIDMTQTMIPGISLSGRTMVSLDMNILYYNAEGASYSEKFTLSLPVSSYSTSYTPITPTPKGVFHSQLVITSYQTSIDPLQPGDHFKLEMNVKNVGNLSAKSVTMIVGGGSASGSSGGTPQAGGISAGSGEFSNFAPVGSSNVQSLGDFDPGKSLGVTQQLVVNVSTSPGAFPVRITFSYTDERGNSINDEQIITLLVFRLPLVEVGFYQPLQPFFVGQPGLLPFQVVNLGKMYTTLGNMTVESTAGTFENGQALVGPLDMGGFFTLDTTFYPETSGSVELLVTINYTDDFNQPRTITQTIVIQVEEFVEPIPDPNMPTDGDIPPQGSETFWQKLWRLILGLFGLDSSAPSPEVPVEPIPFETIKPAPGKG